MASSEVGTVPQAPKQIGAGTYAWNRMIKADGVWEGLGKPHGGTDDYTCMPNVHRSCKQLFRVSKQMFRLVGGFWR
jgi:hypothetical protein